MDFKEFAILKNRPTLEQYIKAKTSGNMFNAPSIIHDYEGYLDDDDYHFSDEEINDIARLQALKDADKWRELGIEIEKLHDKYTGEGHNGYSNILAALTHLDSDRINKDKRHAEWLQQVVDAAPDFDTDTKLRSYLNHEWLDKYPEDSPQDHADEDEWWTTGPYGTYITEAIDKIKAHKGTGEGYKPIDYEAAVKLREQGIPVETQLSDGTWITTNPKTSDLEMIRDYNGKLRIKDTCDSTPLSSSIIDAVDRSY